MPTGPVAQRLRSVTGNKFPRRCSCGCGREIPRDPEIRLVVDFGAPRPYPAYSRDHSADFGSYRGLGLDVKFTYQFSPDGNPSSVMASE
jgi:hypothetical protein